MPLTRIDTASAPLRSPSLAAQLCRLVDEAQAKGDGVGCVELVTRLYAHLTVYWGLLGEGVVEDISAASWERIKRAAEAFTPDQAPSSQHCDKKESQ